MHTSWLTAEHYAALSSQPSGAFISPLPAFDCLTLAGVDNRKYLQGQTTCDVNSLTEDNFLHGAHCDAKGKMWSQFYLLADADKLIAIAFRDEMAASYAQWKKFGVFSKVSFEPGQAHFAVFGIGGPNVSPLLQQLGFTIDSTTIRAGQLYRHGSYALLALSAGHLLLLTSLDDAKALMQQPLPFAAPTVWLAQHIQQGFSYLEQALIGELVPQMLNLQALDAISFTKGCYIGQETVARLKYRGGNKRAAYILSAQTDESPVAGSAIEIQLGENWRRTGQVVNAANINNQLWLIAVLPNDTTAADTLRLSSDSAPLLRIEPLPYSLN
ncbi:MAG: tRNA-modifying protein YgfZ [Gammaproteobacteria bacterium]|nr:tRNA-modifying protein YgfZ [Gammaproteobacteria bacterium]MBU1554507.1 tRNA-modifying protein YgfZ [Gammaproteobacteria bacterium]MBU2071966.1 tRNA-modifying protein YgfZ [Gammaproteobacteria bacterium]MBU2181827.1 tRNA-modifying protein YgfZ [Gammaproteobacteria bacterium]MBU2204328.1 tRNA-modifying protein YgfZ [Gammaproteobacteria bacterium]